MSTPPRATSSLALLPVSPLSPSKALTLAGDSFYKAYYAMDEVPLDLGPFVTDQDGATIVHMGEIFCRIEISPGQLCGRKYKETGALKTHIKRHNVKDVSAGRIGAAPLALVARELVWYKSVVEKHNAAVYRAWAAQAPRNTLPCPPPWSVIRMHHDNNQLNCTAMSQVVKLVGRHTPCEDCDMYSDETGGNCLFSRDHEAYRCTNRDLWIELATIDNLNKD